MPTKKTCDLCGLTFSRNHILRKHISREHGSGDDGRTGSEISLSDNMKKKKQHIRCLFCVSKFDSKSELRLHVEQEHKSTTYQKTSAAIDGKICVFKKNLYSENGSLTEFCNSKTELEDIFNLIKTQLTTRSVFRMSLAISANYELPVMDEAGGSSDNDTFTLRSKGLVVNELEGDTRIKNKIKSLLQGAASREEDLLTRGSGWRFETLQSCDIIFYDVCYFATKKNR